MCETCVRDIFFLSLVRFNFTLIDSIIILETLMQYDAIGWFSMRNEWGIHFVFVDRKIGKRLKECAVLNSRMMFIL